MKPTRNDPDREPNPPDPELEALARLYRDHPPPEPAAQAWQSALSHVQARLDRPNRPRWHVPLVLGLVTAAAAALGGVLLARNLWPAPAVAPEEPDGIAQQGPDANDEPFPVASLREVDILRVDPNDADRIVVGQPVMGTMEFVTTEEIDLVQVDGCPEDGTKPHLHRNAGGPMIIIARADAGAAP
jgi:hypothetical protein